MALTESLRNESFDKVRSKLGDRQWEVFVLVAHHAKGLSAWQVANLLKRPIYVVRPRLTELRGMGLLHVVGVTYHPETQRRESIWAYRPPVLPPTVNSKTGQVEFL